MRVSTIRPGLLVALNTRVTGNVSYQRQDIDAAKTEDGAVVTKWETERTVRDAAELQKASDVRSKARQIIAQHCIASSFGLLCPDDRAEKLTAAIEDARQMADNFNRSATLTRVQVYVIAGRIAADDVEATRAINSELSGLLATMESGVRNLDVEAIRDAAKRAKALAGMVKPGASERLEKAIDTARAAARTLVKAGEQAAVQIDYAAIKAITESRTAFLDLDEAREMQAPAVTGRALDLETTPAPTIKTDAAPVPQLDLI